MGLTLWNDYHEGGGVKEFPFYMAELSRASILRARAQFRLSLSLAKMQSHTYTIDCILLFLLHPTTGATQSSYIMRYIHYYHIQYEKVDCILHFVGRVSTASTNHKNSKILTL